MDPVQNACAGCWELPGRPQGVLFHREEQVPGSLVWAALCTGCMGEMPCNSSGELKSEIAAVRIEGVVYILAVSTGLRHRGWGGGRGDPILPHQLC